jgi:hypothetical protein
MNVKLDKFVEALKQVKTPEYCELCGNPYNKCDCQKQQEKFWKLQKEMDLDESI